MDGGGFIAFCILMEFTLGFVDGSLYLSYSRLEEDLSGWAYIVIKVFISFFYNYCRDFGETTTCPSSFISLFEHYSIFYSLVFQYFSKFLVEAGTH
jgi:hypothetical protein